MDKYKKVVIKIFFIFLFITAVFIFFSSTISNLTLPKVELGFIERGNLDNGLEGEGYVTYSGEKGLYSEEQGEITLFVESYDTVEKGDLLYTIKEVKDSQNSKIEKIYEVYADKKYYIIDLFTETGEIITENVKVMQVGDIEQLMAVVTLTKGTENIDEIAMSKRDILVNNEHRGIYNTVGTLKRVYKQNNYITEVLFESDDLLINETVTINYKEDTSIGNLPYILPNSAVYEIDQKNKIYVLKKEEGVLFDSYYLEEVPVKIYNRDSKHTTIDKESIKDYLEMPIVINSNFLIYDGAQVSIEEGYEIDKVR